MIVRLRKSSSILYVGLGLLSLTVFTFVIHQSYTSQQSNKVFSSFSSSGASSDARRSPIILVETSGKPYLEPREACAIEAAAMHHPKRIVHYYVLLSMVPTAISVMVLQRLSNVHIEILNLTRLFQGTPLDPWFENGAVRDSQFPVEHLSDAVRLALLWKKGGIYLDTDVITVRPLDDLRNAIGLQQPEEVNGAVLVFDRGHPFLEACMVSYAQNYSKSEWASQGPDLVTRMLKQTCNANFLSEAILDPDTCQGVSLHPQTSFYPIPWPEWPRIFQPTEMLSVDTSHTYTIHLWGKLSRDTALRPGDGSLLDELMRDHCPLTYALITRRNIVQ